MKVKGTGSWSVLEEYVKDNYYAMFHTAINAVVFCFLFYSCLTSR